MEKAESTLKVFINSQMGMGTKLKTHLSASIVQGIKVLHSIGIAHCDIKPENILIVISQDQTPNIKLCGFGSARLVSAKSITHAIGTANYIAPEILSAKENIVSASDDLCKADIWSIGKILYFIWTKGELLTENEAKHQDHIPFSIDDASVKKLITACLYDDKNMRIKIDDLLQQILEI